MSEIITPWGLCFTFNIAYNYDLLNLNITSNDFHYLNSQREISENLNARPPNKPRKISTSKAGLWVGFGAKAFSKDVIKNDFNGFKVLHHDPFELPTKKSKIMNFNLNLQTSVLIDPEINSIDEALLGYGPEE